MRMGKVREAKRLDFSAPMLMAHKKYRRGAVKRGIRFKLTLSQFAKFCWSWRHDMARDSRIWDSYYRIFWPRTWFLKNLD